MTSNRPYLLRAIHEWICDNGLTPYIVVDAARPGLEVPPQAVSDGRVVLNLAPRAIAHLEIGNDAITFMARFGGVGHTVTVPIAAVQAIYARENGQGMLLAEDAGGAPAAAPATRVSPALQAVPATEQGETAAPTDTTPPSKPDTDPDKPRPRGKPSLHVVR